MSRLRDEEAKKKKLQQSNDILLEIGKEGKEGIKNFQEYAKGQEKKHDAKILDHRENLEKLEKSKVTYNQFLQKLLVEELRSIDWPFGWSYNTASTDIGVVLELKSPKGKYYRTAFRSTGDGMLDLNAVHTFAVRAENTIDKDATSGIIV